MTTFCTVKGITIRVSVNRGPAEVFRSLQRDQEVAVFPAEIVEGAEVKWGFSEIL